MIKNKNIVLTGCNSGIGYETLKIFLKGGNRVLGVDKNTYNLPVPRKNLTSLTSSTPTPATRSTSALTMWTGTAPSTCSTPTCSPRCTAMRSTLPI